MIRWGFSQEFGYYTVGLQIGQIYTNQHDDYDDDYYDEDDGVQM